jgi:hypothetical protein
MVDDQLLEALAALDAAGGRLTLVDGRVRVDVDQELPETVWSTLARCRDELVATLAGDRPIWDDAPIWPSRGPELHTLPLPAGVDRCDRCRSTETVDQPIHGGASVRRDCAACGRFRAFARWHGFVMPSVSEGSQLSQNESCTDAASHP